MGASEWECGLRSVIEARGRPGGGGVAELAVLREAGGGVIRVFGRLVVRQMARVASGVERGELPVGMALRADHRRVSAGERESGVIVIEAGRRPSRRGVAELALLGEAGGGVIWVLGRLIILDVT